MKEMRIYRESGRRGLFERVARKAFPCLLLLLLLPLSGEEVHRFFRVITNRDGLSQNTVKALFQDRQGFLWIGTKEGFNRFDGRSFQVFRQGFSSISLENGYVQAFQEDRKDRLWVGTKGGGLNIYDPNKGTIERVASKVPLGPEGKNINFLYSDREKTLWIGTERGLFSYGREGLFRKRRLFEGPGVEVLSLVEDSQGVFWVALQGGRLCRWSKREEKIVSQETLPLSSGDGINTLLLDSRRRLWIGTSRGLFLRKGDSPAHPLPHVAADPFRFCVSSLQEDKGGKIWVATIGAGLYRLDPESLAFTRFKRVKGETGSLSLDTLTVLLLDRSENLWVGTDGAGLNLKSPHRGAFLHYGEGQPPPLRIDILSVRALLYDRERTLWVSGYDGLERYREGVRVYRSDKPFYSLLQQREPPYTLWLGSEGQGLYTLRLGEERPRPFRPRKGSLPGALVYSLLQSRDGFLWIGTNQGLSRLHLPTGEVKAVPLPRGEESAVNVLLELEEELLVGTDNGVMRLNPKSLLWKRTLSGGPGGLLNARILSLFKDSRGRVWVGTNGGGVALFDLKSGSVRNYTEEDGLNNNVVNAVQEGSPGELWLATNRGLDRLETESGRVRVYDENDGTGGSEYNQGAFCRSPEGDLLFGGIHGYTRLHLGELRESPRPPEVVATEVKLQNKTIPGALLKRGVSFSSSEKIVSFGFAVLDYFSPGKDKTLFRLEGFDREWRRADPLQSSVVYTNLAPGKYSFRVIAANRDGIWNRWGVTLPVRVRPTLLQALWFRLLAGGGLLLLLLGFVGLHFYRSRRREERLEREVNERTAEVKGALAEREKLIEELRRLLKNVKELNGLLPICCNCKKIRDDKGYWHQVENYIEKHSRAEFTHGLCPECRETLYPKRKKKEEPES